MPYPRYFPKAPESSSSTMGAEKRIGAGSPMDALERPRPGRVLDEDLNGELNGGGEEGEGRKSDEIIWQLCLFLFL